MARAQASASSHGHSHGISQSYTLRYPDEHDKNYKNPPPYEAVHQYPLPTAPPPTKVASGGELEKIIAIPATSSKLGSPFLRAYPPALNSFGIPQDVFLQFLDHMNRVAVASPPVQVLGLAGNIVGMVPLHTTQIVGGALNATATLTTVAMSKGRVELLLRDANKDIFGPCGLRVRVAKLDAVAQLAGIPILDERGRIDPRSPVLGPMEGDMDSEHLSAQQRRLAALAPWISPLAVEDLPTVDQPTNGFSRMHASVSERQRAKEEKKLLKERRKAQDDWKKDSRDARRDFDEAMQKILVEEDEISRQQGPRAEKNLAKLRRSREKVEREYHEKIQKASRERRKDDGEEKMMRKILFLVVSQA